MSIKQGSDSKIYGILIFPIVSCKAMQRSEQYNYMRAGETSVP